MKPLFKSDSVNITEVDGDGNTLLHIAAKSSNVEIVTYLIGKGFDLKSPNKKGDTPLHVAIKAGSNERAILLITDATIDHVNDDGKTPLYLAVENKLYNTVKALLEKNANPFKAHNHKKPSDLCASQISGPLYELKNSLLKHEASWKLKVSKPSCDNISSTLSSS